MTKKTTLFALAFFCAISMAESGAYVGSGGAAGTVSPHNSVGSPGVQSSGRSANENSSPDSVTEKAARSGNLDSSAQSRTERTSADQNSATEQR